ncbi:hypothetical protein M427DRAFT_54412 [Gonapodya prolifera JEL478]|uniref:Uncharacterized protein n=1 Tax=Gonapodya prolifera (strain JEL478) TaxID=1344416 RepID=A0A139AMT4_GONPJ|nr:hypothetical protein M427DRAFT_54412 [Gonapodya prolifera JEL478]|eukprot:KXS17833.1 hypothetical protein M427DRAFT_54412 [Gonapodya prolifera JEL478]
MRLQNAKEHLVWALSCRVKFEVGDTCAVREQQPNDLHAWLNCELDTCVALLVRVVENDSATSAVDIEFSGTVWNCRIRFRSRVSASPHNQ